MAEAQAAQTSSTPAAAAASPGAAGSSPSPTTPSAAGGAPAPANVDPSTASEVLRRAKTEKRARELEQENKALRDKAAKWTKAEEAKAKGDYVAYLEALGDDPDEFYVKATDAINARTVAAKDPKAIARAEAEAVIAKQREADATEAEKRSIENYTSAVSHTLRAEHAKYPHVVTALATGDLERSDLHVVARALAEQGQDSRPAAVLAFINAQYAPQTAAAGEAAKPAPAASQAPPSSLASNVPVATDKSDDSDVDANYAKAMAALRAQRRQ